MRTGTTAITKGDLSRSITIVVRGEVDALKNNLNQMIETLRDTTQRNTEQNWLKTNLANFTRALQGQRDLLTVSKRILSELAPVLQAQHGVLYLCDESGPTPVLTLHASYAFKERKGLATRFQLGEGLVGQCALEKERILMTDVPADYVQIQSGLGAATPYNVVVLPVIFEGQIKGVIELASFNRWSDIQLTFLDQLGESIGVVLNMIQTSMRTESLLTQSQTQGEELQTRQAELAETNQRLQQQAHTLQLSEQQLQQQQQQLQQANTELEDKAQALEAQKQAVETKNQQIELARTALQQKAEQLSLASKYKSEFLANMSHELRTPLNSLLLLSQMLSENRDGNLTPTQQDYCQTIYSSGSDLLSLINEILDMAKIESGTVSVELAELPFSVVQSLMESTFRQVAQNKGLAFSMELAPTLPASLFTDSKRLTQVLKNLLSNAFKFTHQGGVTLRIAPATQGWNGEQASLNRADQVIAFAVSDTGIGIPADKRQQIFEAFQQANTGTARQYGGTGLGLSISREIAQLLGGEIQLESTVGQGSTFTLYLPRSYTPVTRHADQTPAAVRQDRPTDGGTAVAGGPPLTRSVSEGFLGRTKHEALDQPPHAMSLMTLVADDQATLQPGDRVLLVIEDDIPFTKILLQLARSKGFKVVVALDAETGLALAEKLQPVAITLDMLLPDRDGWSVLERLKQNPATIQIPVHIMSVIDEPQRGLAMGAVSYLTKPVSREALDRVFDKIQNFLGRPPKRLLVVEPHTLQRDFLASLLGEHDIQIVTTETGAEALAALQSETLDGMVLDLRLPDLTGLQLLRRMQTELALRRLPVVLYTNQPPTEEESVELTKLSRAIVLKDQQAPERLLAEVRQFLHSFENDLPESPPNVRRPGEDTDQGLAHKKVLIVDDDLRNIFALTALLEQEQMRVHNAESGPAALSFLQATPDIDVVLMDIMMPGMDGYETIRRIRERKQFQSLPIIAVTAKAMKEDRVKCLDAGASDYITKPVDGEQLLSLLHIWLHRQPTGVLGSH